MSRPISDVVEIFTDGACRGNPGPGGWGVLLRFGDREKVLSGAESHTTNNRMELMAAIRGLEALNRPCRVKTGDGLPICADRSYRVVAGVETPVLENREPSAGEERRLMATTR